MNEDLPRAFGQAVKLARIRLNWSQLKLAHRAGVDPTYISGLESGRRNPSLTTVQRIAGALGMQVRFGR